jgi:hypothetical protein
MLIHYCLILWVGMVSLLSKKINDRKKNEIE